MTRPDDHMGWAEPPATPPGTALLLEVAAAVPHLPAVANTLRQMAPKLPVAKDAARAIRALNGLGYKILVALPAALRARVEGGGR